MANVKISELPVATLPLTGAEELPIVQAGVTNKVSTSNVSPAAISKYVPAGSGAVQTTVQTKLRESVSVKDFGAVGNGVTDDTAAIQAAVDSVLVSVEYFPNGNVLLFPEGNYKISEAITINGSLSIATSGQVTISGNLNSATKKCAFYIGDVAYIGTNNGWFKVEIDGLYFNLSNHQYCVNVQGIRTIKIRNCVFIGGSLASFSAEGVWAASYIKESQFWNGSQKAIQILDNSNGFLISNNRIGNYLTTNGLGVYVRASSGVWIQNNDFEYNYAQITVFGTATSLCNNIHIENNWVEGATGHSVRIDNETYGLYGVTIRANSFYGDPDGGVYLGIAGGAGQIIGAIVDGNTFNSPAQFYRNSVSTKYIDVSVKNNYPDASNVKMPAFRAIKTSPQIISANTYEKIIWQSEQFDRGNFFSGNLWSPSTSNNSLVRVKASIAYSAGNSSGDFLAIAIYKNGVLFKQSSIFSYGSPNETISVDTIDICNGTTDYYEAYAFARFGGTLSDVAAIVWFEGMMLDF